MNKHGQVFFYTFMLGVVVLLLAVALSVPLKQVVDDARNDTKIVNYSYEGSAPDGGGAVMYNGTIETQGLDCSNDTISTFNKGQCIITDLATPYFFYGLLAIAGMIIGAKVVFG